MSNVLGYISSTRKKSCRACVKSKRRCDLGYPYCKRCYSKGLDCVYPIASSSSSSATAPLRRKKPLSHEDQLPAEVVLRQGTPELQLPLASVVASTTGINFVLDPIFDSTDLESICFGATAVESSSGGSSSSAEGVDERWNTWEIQPTPQTAPLQWPIPQLTRELIPSIIAPTYLNSAQVFYIVQALLDFVPNMAYSGSTTFLHKDLYQSQSQSHERSTFQDCVAISALYMAHNTRNQHILASTITSKISHLISTSKSWTLSQHLAAVQALIIYQVIRLFDTTLNLQDQAARHNALLELWTAHLWKRFFNESLSHTSCHNAFVFNESVRRTVMMSVFVRCAWSCVTRDGLVDQLHVLARLPITRDVGVWKDGGGEWGSMGLERMRERERLCSYEGFVEGWSIGGGADGDGDGGGGVRGLDAFSRLLLAACRGKEDPRLLV